MYIRFDTLVPLTFRDASLLIRGAAGRSKMRDLRIADLAMSGDGDVFPEQHGVYLFFDQNNETCMYVGKAQSTTFIERLPWHFATGEAAKQNILLKRLKDRLSLPDLGQALRAAQEFSLIMVSVPDQKSSVIAGLEKALQMDLDPMLNQGRWVGRSLGEKVHLRFEDALAALGAN